MGLSWRGMAVVVGLSFGLGAIAASHKVILAKLGQATDTFTALDRPEWAGQGGTPSSAPNSDALQTVLPLDITMPKRGDVRIIVISDLNGPYRSIDYSQEVLSSVRAIPEWEPDLVLSAGDMIAGQLLSLTAEDLQAMWQGFDQHIFQPIRQADIPFAFALGKHDGSAMIQPETRPKSQVPQGDLFANIPAGSYIFAQERAAAQAYWTASDRTLGIDLTAASNFPFQYSFVHRDIFFLVWDASTAELDETALKWAEQQLSSPAAQQASMRISVGHFPLYAIAQGRDRPSEFLNQGDAIRTLLETYDVHTHISGHHHAYYPGRVGELELLYSGALGAGPRSLLGTDEPATRTLTVMDIFLDASEAPDVWTLEDEDDSTAQTGRSQRPEPEVLEGIATVYTTYNMSTLEVIEPTTLPRVVASPTGLVLRQDMQRRDLTYQDNLRYVRSW